MRGSREMSYLELEMKKLHTSQMENIDNEL